MTIYKFGPQELLRANQNYGDCLLVYTAARFVPQNGPGCRIRISVARKRLMRGREAPRLPMVAWDSHPGRMLVLRVDQNEKRAHVTVPPSYRSEITTRS